MQVLEHFLLQGYSFYEELQDEVVSLGLPSTNITTTRDLLSKHVKCITRIMEFRKQDAQLVQDCKKVELYTYIRVTYHFECYFNC